MAGMFACIAETIHGPVNIVYRHQRGIYSFSFPQSLKKEGGGNKIASELPDYLEKLENDLNQYFKGNYVLFDYPFDFSGYSPFQIRILKAVQQIPFGRRVTYTDVALAAGYTVKFCRAVGRVMAANRCPLLIPCHRVVGANGETGGYSGGKEWKEYLLNIEKKSVY